MDKWLWAARFFKTRSLAARACDLGRIECNGQAAKPARELKPGDRLRVTNDSGVFEIEVAALSEVRGPAAAAQALYRESEASRAARQLAAEQRQALHAWDPPPGRPTKRDRRRLQSFRGRG